MYRYKCYITSLYVYVFKHLSPALPPSPHRRHTRSARCARRSVHCTMHQGRVYCVHALRHRGTASSWSSKRFYSLHAQRAYLCVPRDGAVAVEVELPEQGRRCGRGRGNLPGRVRRLPYPAVNRWTQHDRSLPPALFARIVFVRSESVQLRTPKAASAARACTPQSAIFPPSPARSRRILHTPSHSCARAPSCARRFAGAACVRFAGAASRARIVHARARERPACRGRTVDPHVPWKRARLHPRQAYTRHCRQACLDPPTLHTRRD
jgi:hypothetical protein